MSNGEEEAQQRREEAGQERYLRQQRESLNTQGTLNPQSQDLDAAIITSNAIHQNDVYKMQQEHFWKSQTKKLAYNNNRSSVVVKTRELSEYESLVQKNYSQNPEKEEYIYVVSRTVDGPDICVPDPVLNEEPLSEYEKMLFTDLHTKSLAPKPSSGNGEAGESNIEPGNLIDIRYLNSSKEDSVFLKRKNKSSLNVERTTLTSEDAQSYFQSSEQAIEASIKKEQDEQTVKKQGSDKHMVKATRIYKDLFKYIPNRNLVIAILANMAHESGLIRDIGGDCGKYFTNASVAPIELKKKLAIPIPSSKCAYDPETSESTKQNPLLMGTLSEEDKTLYASWGLIQANIAVDPKARYKVDEYSNTKTGPAGVIMLELYGYPVYKDGNYFLDNYPDIWKKNYRAREGNLKNSDPKVINLKNKWKEIITNYTKQINFVTWYTEWLLGSKEKVMDERSLEYWVAWFTNNVEKPSQPRNISIQKRLKRAEGFKAGLSASGQEDLDPSAEKLAELKSNYRYRISNGRNFKTPPENSGYTPWADELLAESSTEEDLLGESSVDEDYGESPPT